MTKKILVIDDDKDILQLLKKLLVKSGYEVNTLEDSKKTIEKVESFKPDLLIVDLLMPDIDGFTLIKNIREEERFSSIKIVVASAKTFEFDQKWAYELGANAFLKKPLDFDKLAETIERVLEDEITVTFWGTRGTYPTPGNRTLKFGGNTSCVSVELSKDRLFIFDAGTGIIELGKHLIAQKKRFKMNLFISHPHWDHIHGFPFFIPLYTQGNEMVILGSSHGNLSLREVISGQMESIYFPVTIREFSSRVYFNDITEGSYKIEGITVSTIMLNHPGIALGYRLNDSSGKSLAYIADNEIVPQSTKTADTHFRQKLVKFLKNVDVLIHDSTFFDDEYKMRVGWGHPPITEVLRLAAEANVKSLYLCHHDPDHNDEKVAEKEAFAMHYFRENNHQIQCCAAIEGKSIRI